MSASCMVLGVASMFVLAMLILSVILIRSTAMNGYLKLSNRLLRCGGEALSCEVDPFMTLLSDPHPELEIAWMGIVRVKRYLHPRIRLCYYHYGVAVRLRDGRVIVAHYNGSFWSPMGEIVGVPLEKFEAMSTERVEFCDCDDSPFDRVQLLGRIGSRLGERNYKMTSNNCQHFTSWCFYNRPHCDQIPDWTQGLETFLFSKLNQ